MNHLIIYTHPRKSSFNHAILDTLVEDLLHKGHEVVVRDLYGMNFQPVLGAGEIIGGIGEDVVHEQAYIVWADVITFIYPIWWTGLPAMLKGYIDRVFSYGFAYTYENGAQEGRLKGKKINIIHTQSKSHGEYEMNGMGEALRLTTDEGIFAYCGFDVIHHLIYDSISSSTEGTRKAWLNQIHFLN